jgi:hypothetical protein
MGVENKKIPNGPYCGFRDEAYSIGVVGKTREVCMDNLLVCCDIILWFDAFLI